MHSFLQLLQDGEEQRNFQPDWGQGDYYEMVFYTGEAIAYKYSLQYDGITHFWHPWETEILSDEIADFLEGI
ncbi:hypothetical protein J2S74_000020 [Evansella vedderi]|uniref:DUF3298 domain-containing protein n=1 Tax=Evansella vedderi TaxID=38282 RepID=A0ABT9ZN41_9BACI|nr:hypothetical protein [Evansella vedderi]MDQ0252648.1 hypothetical protein [Evansella vedderi]